MIATKTLLLKVMGPAGRENGGKAKNCRVLRRVLRRVLARVQAQVLVRVLARYIGILEISIVL